jgi:hypothetical protein
MKAEEIKKENKIEDVCPYCGLTWMHRCRDFARYRCGTVIDKKDVKMGEYCLELQAAIAKAEKGE